MKAIGLCMIVKNEARVILDARTHPGSLTQSDLPESRKTRGPNAR